MCAQHSKLAPSSAGQWVKCPGSINLKAQFPELRDSDAAKEGEASHEAAAFCLTHGKFPAVGDVASNGVVFTEEMFTFAKVYVDNVASTMLAPSSLHIEERVHAPRVHEDSWGTVDCWGFGRSVKTIYLWDYKYGYGIIDVKENWQLINYAIGIIDEITWATKIPDTELIVDMRVVQPRPFHKEGAVRSWRVKASDLRTHANMLYGAAHEALGENPSIVSSDNCRYCEARHCCTAALNASYNAIDVSENISTYDIPIEGLEREINTVRRAMKALEYRLTGLEAQIISRIQAGEHIPGLAIERGGGRLKWNIPNEEVFVIGDLLGINLRKESCLTPTQAKNLGIDKTTINSNSEKSSSGMNLISSKETIAHKAFSKS